MNGITRILMGYLFAARVAYGAVLFQIEGVVADFDDRAVILELEGGKRLRVMRGAFGSVLLRPGKRVAATVDARTILEPVEPRHIGKNK